MFDLLLSKGADVNSSGGVSEYTPLSVAAANNDVALLDRLLKAGAKSDLPFLSNRKTALMVAAAANSADCVKRLLEAGASVTPVLVLSPGAADQNPAQGSSALHLAVSAGALESVVLLLKAGADPNAPDGKEVLPLPNGRKQSAAG